MAKVYFFKDLALTKVETHLTWEDAYLSVFQYAKDNDLEMRPNGAISQDSKQFVKIFN